MDDNPKELCADRTSKQLADLCRLVARHSRVGTETAIPGVRVASVASDATHTSLSGTVLALIVQGAKVLAIGTKMYADHHRSAEALPIEREGGVGPLWLSCRRRGEQARDTPPPWCRSPRGDRHEPDRTAEPVGDHDRSADRLSRF